MFRSSITIGLVAIGIVAAFIIGSAGSTGAATAKQCSDAYSRCVARCDGKPGAGTEGSPYEACIGKCGLALVDCSPWSLPQSSGNLQGSTGTTQPPPKREGGQPPVNVGTEQPPGGTPPPKGVIGPPPGNVGVNKPPVGDGGTSPPKGGVTGVHPVYPVNPPVNVNQPGTGTGEQIYAKSGEGKPVVTTSPIGITTTTVTDKNGNSRSTMTDPTGNILFKTTTILDPNGGSKSTTTGADGKILRTTTKTPNKDGGYISVIEDSKGRVSRAVHNSAGQIVSQGKKITTTGTGGTYSKSHKEFQGEGSQKHKEKGTNELFHEDKQKLNSSSAPSHSQGRHR